MKIYEKVEKVNIDEAHVKMSKKKIFLEEPSVDHFDMSLQVYTTQNTIYKDL